MKADFEIKMTTGSMYRFLMYHMYHNFSGIFSIFAGIGLIVVFFMVQGTEKRNTWVYLFFGILFLIYQPVSLYMQSAKQTKLNAFFKNPIQYHLSEKGITVSQGKASNEVAWDGIVKVRETRSNILVYTGAKNAFIWVKNQMGDETEKVRRILQEYAPAGKGKK